MAMSSLAKLVTDAGHERMAVAALSVGAMFIALSPIFVRISELGPSATAWYRMFLALPIYGLWVLLPSQTPSAAPPERHGGGVWLWIAGLAFAADLACWHWSINYTTVANATLLANLAPVFVSLAAWHFFGDQVGWRFVMGLVLAISGAVLLVHASLRLDPSHLLGDALGLLTALFYATYLLAIKKLQNSGMGNGRIMLYSAMISVFGLSVITLLSGETLLAQSWRGWSVLLALAWVSQGLGQGLITYGMSQLPASYSSVNLLLQPVAAALLAWLLLGEAMGPWQLLGAITILTGIIVTRFAISAKTSGAVAINP